MKIHYHSDCYFFAGCENVLVNLLNNKKFISENEISFSFPSFSYYNIGYRRRIKEGDISKYPVFLPDHPKLSYWLQKKNMQIFFRRLSGSPIYFLEQIYIFTLYDIVRLYFLFKKIRPDLLHINNGGYPGAVSCRSAVIAAKLAKIDKIVFHVNNVAEDPISYNMAKRVVERIYDTIINKNVDIFITGSSFAGMKLLENRKIDINKIITIPNTFIPRRIIDTSDCLKRKFNLKEDDLIFGVVAILTKRKGHSVLIKAFDLLRKNTDEFDKIKLVIEGSGEEEKRLKELVNGLRLEENVLFIGDQENIFDIYNMIDVFVLPSVESEDMPNVIIESMSLGKPIIGTNLAGIPEEIENNVNGFIVEVNNEEELSIAMLKFIKDRNLIKKMGQKSKEIFEQKFEYNKTLQKIIDLYK